MSARQKFSNPETEKEFDYTGSWTVRDQEKRIACPGIYDGLLCEVTPEAAEKLIGKVAGLKKKDASTSRKEAGTKDKSAADK